MTAELVPFVYEGRRVRSVLIDGQPWFVAADVCAVLDIKNGRDALTGLDDDERGVATTDTPGGDQQVSIINEPGLYSLILRSRKPEAKKFKRWVTHDVIPQIRRTGGYGTPAELTRLELIEMARSAELERLALARELEATSAELAVAQPDAQAWRTLAQASGDFSVGDAAKILSRDPAIKLGERRLFGLLAELGWIFRQQIDRRYRPYQAVVDTGRLSELPQTHYHPRTGELSVDPPQVRVTVKGLRWLHQHLGGAEQIKLDLSEVA